MGTFLLVLPDYVTVGYQTASDGSVGEVPEVSMLTTLRHLVLKNILNLNFARVQRVRLPSHWPWTFHSLQSSVEGLCSQLSAPVCSCGRLNSPVFDIPANCSLICGCHDAHVCYIQWVNGFALVTSPAWVLRFVLLYGLHTSMLGWLQSTKSILMLVITVG